MAEKLSEEELEGLKATFSEYDEDKSGVICVDELKKGMKNRGVELSDEMLAALDRDGSGKITLDEFIKAFAYAKAFVEEN